MVNDQSLSEESIRPAALMVDKQRFVDADRDFLLSRKHQWVTVVCPACDSTNDQLYGAKQGFTYVECRDCGTVYTNPRPSQELVHEFYGLSQNYVYWNRYIFPATEGTRRERIFRPRAERVMEYCQRFQITTGTLVEVGAAFGTFCEEIGRIGTFERIVALEPTPHLAETCRAKGLEVLEQPIEGVTVNEIADVVAAFEVIEHVFSPRAFIEQCGRLLRPGGLLVLTCPNVRGFDVATLRTLSGSFDHEHVNYFHPASLAALVERCGFSVMEVDTPGRLDAELVRKRVAEGVVDLTDQPFLQEILVNRWEDLGGPFQDFLATHRLSSHMWILGRKN